MNSEADLLQKLMISKKIMDKHNGMERGNSRNVNMGSERFSSPSVQNYDPIPAQYNIPQEYLQEQQIPTQKTNSNLPMEERIASSKLPDEIKRLMMEHPIQQPTMGMASGAVLSDELVEKASRLMNTNAKGDVIQETRQRTKPQQPQVNSNNIDADEIRNIIRETVEELLYENGLLVESETKSNDIFKFRVGQHIFEGKLTKVKKIAK